MKEEDVLRCQIHDWYPRFRQASTRTRLVELPEEFVAYLQRDGLFLPSSSDAMPARTKVTCPELQAEDYQHWEEEDEEQEEADVPSFPALEQEVAACIEALGGQVFPKLNWSAPSDAAWISSSGSLRCSNFGEIILLLKASDSIAYDLKHAFDSCEDRSRDRPATFYLALRKWYDLRPEMEFRCFVRQGLLVGVCQREVTGFYPSLVESKRELEMAVALFFEDTVRSRFGAEDYTFDCYVLKDLRVKVIDFNPWGGSTLPLLFSWEELEENYQHSVQNCAPAACNGGQHLDVGVDRIDPGDALELLQNLDIRENMVKGGSRVDFRIVMSEGLVRPGVRSCSGVPFDFVETGPGSAWDDFLKQADTEIRQQTAEAGG